MRDINFDKGILAMEDDGCDNWNSALGLIHDVKNNIYKLEDHPNHEVANQAFGISDQLEDAENQLEKLQQDLFRRKRIISLLERAEEANAEICDLIEIFENASQKNDEKMSMEDGKNRHPAELGQVIRDIHREHEEANVAQQGFHPDFVKSLVSVLSDCLKNWEEAQENMKKNAGIEAYLENDRQQILNELKQIIENFNKSSDYNG